MALAEIVGGEAIEEMEAVGEHLLALGQAQGPSKKGGPSDTPTTAPPKGLQSP